LKSIALYSRFQFGPMLVRNGSLVPLAAPEHDAHTFYACLYRRCAGWVGVLLICSEAALPRGAQCMPLPAGAQNPRGLRGVELIIRRYLYREVLQSFLGVLMVLLLIFGSMMFVRLLTEASTGAIPGNLLIQIMLLELVGRIAVIFPAALYVGILLALGRLYKDSEIVAMWAGGIGTREFVLSLFWLLLGFAIVMGALALFVSPQALSTKDQLWKQAREQAELTGLAPGRFMELRGGELVAYVESLSSDGRSMDKAFAQLMSAETRDLLVAERAYIRDFGEDGGRYVVLEDGYRYSGAPGNVDFVISRFSEHAFRIEPTVTGGVVSKADAQRTGTLLANSHPVYKAELQWRISQPVFVILLGLLAIPLARTSPRQGKYAKLVLGIVIYFLYANAVGIVQNLIERGELSPIIGIWPVHVVMAILITFMLRYQSSTSRLRLFGLQRRLTA
jgi:lipopolysaccharide export system permease protein